MRMGEAGRAVRLGIIGLGARGSCQTELLLTMPDVTIVAVCDVYQDRVNAALQTAQARRGEAPAGAADYRAVLDRDDIEAVVVMTGWETHIPIAIEAMRRGKAVAMEVGGASTLDECWRLVRAGEQTGRGCMLLENCCYGLEETTLLCMIRQGVFGDIVHCRGAYEHDLRDEIGNGDINRHYRQAHFRARNGELYPTHALGPIAKYLRLNHGNRMLSLVSMASRSAGQAAWMAAHRPALSGMRFNQGDVVNTLIKCANGETILLTHDCTLPRPYSRGGRVQGTKGIWMEDNRSIFLDGVSPVDPTHWTHRWEPDAPYIDAYKSPLWREYEAFGARGGHGGMDYLCLRAFVESLQHNQPFPIDVYDTASWMAVTALSEQSVAMGGAPVPVPDFTGGLWLTPRVTHKGRYALD